MAKEQKGLDTLKRATLENVMCANHFEMMPMIQQMTFKQYHEFNSTSGWHCVQQKGTVWSMSIPDHKKETVWEFILNKASDLGGNVVWNTFIFTYRFDVDHNWSSDLDFDQILASLEFYWDVRVIMSRKLFAILEKRCDYCSVYKIIVDDAQQTHDGRNSSVSALSTPVSRTVHLSHI